MIEKHLLAQTEPTAHESNIILFEDYRVTVLSNRLFRIEKMHAKPSATPQLNAFGSEICLHRTIMSSTVRTA